MPFTTPFHSRAFGAQSVNVLRAIFNLGMLSRFSRRNFAPCALVYGGNRQDVKNIRLPSHRDGYLAMGFNGQKLWHGRNASRSFQRYGAAFSNSSVKGSRATGRRHRKAGRTESWNRNSLGPGMAKPPFFQTASSRTVMTLLEQHGSLIQTGSRKTCSGLLY